MRRFAVVCLVTLPFGAWAQTMSESGWTALYTQTTSPDAGSIAAVTVDSKGTIYWGPAGGSTADDAQLPLARRTPTGPGTGSVETLHLTGQVAGLALIGTQLYFSSQSTRTIQRFVPGAVPNLAPYVADPIPSNASDTPAGLAVVPSGWSGGSIVAAGELLVTDSEDPDNLAAISTAGAARLIGVDPGSGYTLIGAAASRQRVLIADGEGARILELASNGTMVLQTLSAPLGGSPVGIAWDPGVTESFIVALAGGTLVRLTLSGATWTRTQIGSGFSFTATGTQVVAVSTDGATLVVASANRIDAFARCSLAGASDCNADNEADVCDVLLAGTGRGLPDCNANGRPDSCDLAAATSTDCDTDTVPDECASCSTPVELVFAVDTTGSVADEAGVLCSNISGIVSALQGEGIDVRPTLYGIGATPGGQFSCLTSTVDAALGTAVPGAPPASSGGANQSTLYSGCTGFGAQQDWGRAANIIAGRFAWSRSAVRVVVSLSEEGPWCGSPVDVADVDSVSNATLTALGGSGPSDDVLISTVLASGYANAANLDVERSAVSLAQATGGIVTREPSGPELVEAIKRLVRRACADQSDCDRNGVADACQLAGNDANSNGRLDVCEGAVDAGVVDAGTDAGAVDAGTDAGAVDAGVDAGFVDAGVDAGAVDAGMDAGIFDAGVDAGVGGGAGGGGGSGGSGGGGEQMTRSGCGCSSTAPVLGLLALLLLRRRRW